MRSVSLDRRVRKEAQLLIRDARAALGARPGLRGTGGDLKETCDSVADALGRDDLTAVRQQLPALDMLVDELVVASGKSVARDYGEAIGGAIVLALALRFLAIEAFKIPSASMYPTLEIGDHIMVNKLPYILGRTPERGEVVVFSQPCMRDKDYIKRVIALAGDTVEVRCNVVYVNGKAIPHELIEAEGCHYTDFDETTHQWFDRKCSRYAETVAGHRYTTFHDEHRPARDRVLRDAGGLSAGDDRDFPRLDRIAIPPSCTRQPTGEPLAAPDQKTGRLVVTRDDVRYNHDGSCEQQMHYVVPEGHVFTMGDNRANSTDSRVWGSVPVDHIRGRALFIWFSYPENFLDPRTYRWDRMGDFVD